jgi:hypothetical protein
LRMCIKLPIESRAREKMPMGRMFEFRSHWRVRPRSPIMEILCICFGNPENKMWILCGDSKIPLTTLRACGIIRPRAADKTPGQSMFFWE